MKISEQSEEINLNVPHSGTYHSAKPNITAQQYHCVAISLSQSETYELLGLPSKFMPSSVISQMTYSPSSSLSIAILTAFLSR